MLFVRKEQMQALGDERQLAFERRLVAHLARHFPDAWSPATSEVGKGAGAEMVHAALARATAVGFATEVDLAKFVGLALAHGSFLDTEPPGPVAPNMDHLYAQALQSADGPGATRLLRAGMAAEAEFSEAPPGTVVAACPLRTWIEIALVGMTGKPIPGERYVIHTAAGERFEGVLDDEGLATVGGIAAGSCRVVFPELDECAVEPI